MAEREGGIDSFAVASGELTQRGATPVGFASKLCSAQSLSNQRIRPYRPLPKTKKGPCGTLRVFGGEGGIRTLDTLLTYTPLAGERLQPLGHFSRFCLLRLYLVLLLHSPVARYSVLCTSPFGSPSNRRRSLAVCDCSVSHSATSPDSSSFSLRSDPLPPPLLRCG